MQFPSSYVSPSWWISDNLECFMRTTYLPSQFCTNTMYHPIFPYCLPRSVHDIRLFIYNKNCPWLNHYVSLRTTLIYYSASSSRISPKHRREKGCVLHSVQEYRSTRYLFQLFLLLAPVSRVSLEGACQPRLGCLSPRFWYPIHFLWLPGPLSLSLSPCHLVQKELPLAHCSGA